MITFLYFPLFFDRVRVADYQVPTVQHTRIRSMRIYFTAQAAHGYNIKLVGHDNYQAVSMKRLIGNMFLSFQDSYILISDTFTSMFLLCKSSQ